MPQLKVTPAHPAHSAFEIKSCGVCNTGRCVHCGASGDADHRNVRFCSWCFDALTDGGNKPLPAPYDGSSITAEVKVKSKGGGQGFPRPELGVDMAARRMDDFISRRKALQRAKLACRTDLFCDGKVVALGMCGGHLRMAHAAGSLDRILGIQKLPETRPSTPLGKIGIGNR